MKFCVIIINYNTKNNVLNLLVDFKQIDSDIFIWDNSNIANEVLAQSELIGLNDRAQVITSDLNLGFGKSINNVLLNFSIIDNYDYFVLWNSDCELNAEYFKEIIESIIINNRIDIIAPRLYDGNEFYYGSKLSWHFLTSNIIRDENYNYSNSLSWPTAAALFIPTHALSEFPLFDPFFFMYWEDADLIQRLKKNGIVVTNFCSKHDFYFRHLPGHSSKSNLINRFLWHLEGHRYFVKKHVRFSTIPLVLLNVKYLVKAIIDGDFNRLKAIINFLKG
jgi:GT2 family glycosyltransferase